MLRNIPNKIDQVNTVNRLWTRPTYVVQAMLKEIVDETSAGKYDFMYLRIGEPALRFLQALVQADAW